MATNRSLKPRMKIVIIDDHALFESALKASLERRNEVVGAAADGEEGIANNAHKPDVVLLDLRMPDLAD